MIWEEGWRVKYKDDSTMIPTALALYGFPIFASIISFAAYFNYKPEIISCSEYLMIILNIIMLIYTLRLGKWAKSNF